MRASHSGRCLDNSEGIVLRRMVGSDRHRPGPARARLLAEQIPVWAIIGHIEAIAETGDPGATCHDEHRQAIHALLEANAAATT
jgi:hypothetical protein